MKKIIACPCCLFFIVLLAALVSAPVSADDAGTLDHQMEGVADEGEQYISSILQLTLNPYLDDAQCWGAYPWSPDGDRIVYRSLRPFDDGSKASGESLVSQICIMNSDGTGWRQVTDFKDARCNSHASFLPNSDNEIVFQRSGTEGEPTGVWMIKEDGSEPVNLTGSLENLRHDDGGDEGGDEGSDHFGFGKPVVSPDGSKIACIGQSRLYVINAVRPPADLGLVNISEFAAARHTWSPDGQWVLYDIGGNYDSAPEEKQMGIPDGDCVAVKEAEGDQPNNDSIGRKIVKTRPDGTETTVLTDDSLEIHDIDGNLIDTASNELPDKTFAKWSAKGENWPVYSPDGNWIAYHARYGVVRQLKGGDLPDANKYEYSTLSIMKPDGSDKKNLVVKGPNYDDGGPYAEYEWVCGPKSWSPDSKWIAFKMSKDAKAASELDEKVGDSEFPTEIFAINMDTFRIVRLTEGYDDFRHWYSPDGSKILFKDLGGAARDDGKFEGDLLVIDLADEENPLEADGDNVPDSAEMGPNGDDEEYDGDGNGIPDFKENRVASMPTAQGDSYASLILDNSNGEVFTTVKTVENGVPPDDIGGKYEFPYGFFEFAIENVVECTTVEIRLPYDINIRRYFKFGPTEAHPEGQWYRFDYNGRVGAEIDHVPAQNPVETVVTLHLCDNELGDDYFTTDGVIKDDGGPAILKNDAVIPTLSEYGLIAAGILLALCGMVALRRRGVERS